MAKRDLTFHCVNFGQIETIPPCQISDRVCQYAVLVFLLLMQIHKYIHIYICTFVILILCNGKIFEYILPVPFHCMT